MKRDTARAELLAAMRATASRSGKRGRPRAQSLAEAYTGMRGVALEVFRRELDAGGGRAAYSDAMTIVAETRGLSRENVKAACKRNKELRTLAQLESTAAQMARDADELRRRMADFPETVREYLAPFSASAVLRLLRAERVNGPCPKWLIETAEAFRLSERKQRA